MPNQNPKNYDYIKMGNNRTHEITGCAGAVLKYFGCMGVTWNNRTEKNVYLDTLRRNGYAVRSRTSQIKKWSSVGAIRAKLAQIADKEPKIEGFIVEIINHVLVLDRNGQTIVDTDQRTRDRRRVLKVYAVWKK